jgi:MerR family transcriptional regulator, copper efflux regulator
MNILPETLTIGQLAKESGVNLETVRFYERRGLLPKPNRSASGYRLFPRRYVGRIRFIKHAQALGFSLKEIQELLALRVAAGVTCAKVRSRAEDKISDIERRIRDLKTMKTALLKLATSCSGRGPVTECPILEALEGESFL